MSLKDNVLKYLIECDEKAVSGQFLATYFNVTRGAIWKVIKNLKNEGYNIEGKNNSGYTFNPNVLIYSPVSLKKHLKDDFNIYIFDCVDSTSTFLKGKVDENNKPCLACAYTQSKGKGRTGKSFYSPKNGVYFSFAFKNNESFNLDLLTIRVGVAVLKALKEVTNKDCLVKWVNDIYYNDKKVCGILCEANIDYESNLVDSIIIGIGINLNTTDFPNDIKEIATSLNVECCDVNLLIGKIINEVMHSKNTNEEILDFYKERCLLLNKDIIYKINNELHYGKAININSYGNLIVDENGKEVVLKSGEVSLGSKKYE